MVWVCVFDTISHQGNQWTVFNVVLLFFWYTHCVAFNWGRSWHRKKIIVSCLANPLFVTLQEQQRKNCFIALIKRKKNVQNDMQNCQSFYLYIRWTAPKNSIITERQLKVSFKIEAQRKAKFASLIKTENVYKYWISIKVTPAHNR